MSLHVVAGLSLGALVVAHALVRGEHRPALVDLVGRRSAIKGIGLLAASIAVTTALDGVALAKRATGSRLAGSFSGNAMPTTIWAFDDVPTVAVDAWRLEVSGSVERPGSRTLADLAALPRTTASAVLDCTGGWWSEQVWSGVRVADLLAAHGVARDATRVEVISVTGHSWSFGREEAERALLATHVGGETISPGHGYPVRLVVPDRRGFTWIKWVRAVRVA